MPANLSFEEAAGIPLVGLTAWEVGPSPCTIEWKLRAIDRNMISGDLQRVLHLPRRPWTHAR